MKKYNFLFSTNAHTVRSNGNATGKRCITIFSTYSYTVDILTPSLKISQQDTIPCRWDMKLGMLFNFLLRIIDNIYVWRVWGISVHELHSI